uniref:Uncharacterized protein n=2 Tax=Phaeomonas parva TaxID=124430 RepID=A0A7S1U8T6_9STRA
MHGDDEDDEFDDTIIMDEDAPLYIAHKSHIHLYASSAGAAHDWAIALQNMNLRPHELARSREQDDAFGGDAAAAEDGDAAETDAAATARFQPRRMILDLSGALDPAAAEAATSGIESCFGSFWMPALEEGAVGWR